MNKHRIVNLCMIVLFCIIITIPTFYINKTSNNVSSSENRMLANFPDVFNQEGQFNANLKTGFEIWFNDNLGFRDRMVQANIQVQFELFNKLTYEDIILGKENWMYLMYPPMIEAYQNTKNLTDEELTRFKENLVTLDQYLTHRDIPFITAIFPDKETIYPEYMPESILKKKPISKTVQVIDYVQLHTNQNLVFPMQELLQEKVNRVVYSQNYDTSHWNSSGAFTGYTELMKKISEKFADITILDDNNFTIKQYTRKRGDISVEEIDYHWIYNEGYSSVEERGALDLFVFENNTNYRYINQKDLNLPKLLILGDSFIHMFMLQNLAESFSEVIFIHMDNIDDLKSYIDVFEPDMFVFQFMEIAFLNFMNSKHMDDVINPYTQYKDLEVVKHGREGLFWIDYSNDKPVTSNTQLIVDTTTPVNKIQGWAIDPINNQTLENVFLKIDHEYYKGEYGLPMYSVVDYFENTNLLHSGFTFSISTSKLMNAKNLSIVAISKDKSMQFAAIPLEILNAHSQ